MRGAGQKRLSRAAKIGPVDVCKASAWAAPLLSCFDEPHEERLAVTFQKR